VNPFVDARNLEIGGHTDKGWRERNEDTFLIDLELGLVVLADGMGGHQCGDVASAITCEAIQREVAAGVDLVTAVQRANTAVLEAARSGRGQPGMGSTVVAVHLTARGYELAWAGDSRIYLWDGKLSLLTRDHSLVQAQLASGRISLEEARTHPRRHVILQAVGTAAQLDVGRNGGELAPNSCLLLCSDGITDPLDSAQLCELLSHRTAADETCERMVNMALQCGGKDNATAVLIACNSPADDPPRRMAPDRVAPDQVVWVYDPATARYTGLPDLASRGPGQNSDFEMTPTRPGRGWHYGLLAALLGTLAAGVAYVLR
jgi:PPM family protein phosphatase